MNQATDFHSKPNVEHHAKNTKQWWQTKRAKQTGAVFGAIAFLGFIVWFFFYFPYVTTDDARVGMTIVRAAPSGVGGRVTKVNVMEGSQIKVGDVLAEIDHRVPQALYDRAKSKAELSEKEFKRMTVLAAQRTATPQALDSAKSSFDMAQAELKQAEVNLENTYIKSSIDGVVIQKNAEVGNILEPGQTAITVADVERAWISANIEETSIGLVKVGQPVTVRIDEGGQLQGHVSEVRAATASQFALISSDNASGNFTKVVQRIPIKVAIDSKSEYSLRAGQSVVIKVRVR